MDRKRLEFWPLWLKNNHICDNDYILPSSSRIVCKFQFFPCIGLQSFESLFLSSLALSLQFPFLSIGPSLSGSPSPEQVCDSHSTILRWLATGLFDVGPMSRKEGYHSWDGGL